MSLMLSADEIREITGGYVQPSKQLAELHRMGYYRARRSALTGAVLLDRAHYEAVNGGDVPKRQPQLRKAHA